MLMHHFTRSATEWRLARQHFPEGHAKRVEIRSDIHGHPSELLRTSKLWSSGKNPGRRNRGLRKRLVYRLRQPEIDDFRSDGTSVLQAHHDVAWFDVPMDEVLLVHRN